MRQDILEYIIQQTAENGNGTVTYLKVLNAFRIRKVEPLKLNLHGEANG